MAPIAAAVYGFSNVPIPPDRKRIMSRPESPAGTRTMAELESKTPARPSWGGRNWWLGVLIVVIVAAVFLASVLTGLLGPPSERPEAVFFVGYPAEGDTLIPAWWSGRASWPAAWLYSDGLRDDAFMGRLKTAGVDVEAIEGTAAAAPISSPGVESAAVFRTEYRSAYGTAPGLYDASSYDAVLELCMETVSVM